VERICEGLQIPFARPTRYPRNGLLAARVVAAAQNEAWVPAFVRSVYVASFAHDLDIADPNVLKDCLRDLTSGNDRLEAALEWQQPAG
jgi:2-hydroxychromene-2-carboxylate isomerase